MVWTAIVRGCTLPIRETVDLKPLNFKAERPAEDVSRLAPLLLAKSPESRLSGLAGASDLSSVTELICGPEIMAMSPPQAGCGRRIISTPLCHFNPAAMITSPQGEEKSTTTKNMLLHLFCRRWNDWAHGWSWHVNTTDELWCFREHEAFVNMDSALRCECYDGCIYNSEKAANCSWCYFSRQSVRYSQNCIFSVDVTGQRR